MRPNGCRRKGRTSSRPGPAAYGWTVVHALPPQPAGVAWPTTAWPRGEPGPDVDTATLAATLDRLFAQPPELGLTLAVVAVHRGRVVAERYGPEVDAGTRLISWSTAKSVTAAAAGLLVGDGRLDLDEPVDVPEWRRDERARITMRHLLAMTPGLRFVEDYVDDTVSHCIDMLFGAGKDDVAAYAAALPLDHEPGTCWNYSSGTTNIVSRLLGGIVGGGEAGMRAFLDHRLFAPLGMASAEPGFDAAGTFIGSSFLHATALDFARFGYLHLRDGWWDGARLLPAGWVDYCRTPVGPVPDTEEFDYGAHWWIWRDEPGSLAAHGYEGQYVVVVPARDLVLVRLGKTPADRRPNLLAALRAIVGAFGPR
jgi:CubicO group peptidase (beta-lactamase class C family)